MHTKALYLKTNSFTNSIMHFIGSSTKQHKKERKKSVSFEPRKEKTEGPRWLPRAERFCYRRINTTTSLVVLFHLPRAERFVRHALLAEPTFLDLRRGCSFYPSLGNSEEMVNSTLPCPIGIDSPLCLLSQHTWRRIVPTMFAGAQSA